MPIDRVCLSGQAQADLQETMEHVGDELDNPAAARRLVILGL